MKFVYTLLIHIVLFVSHLVCLFIILPFFYFAVVIVTVVDDSSSITVPNVWGK